MLLSFCNFTRRIKIRTLSLCLFFFFVYFIAGFISIVFPSRSIAPKANVQSEILSGVKSSVSQRWSMIENGWSGNRTLADCKRLLNSDVNEISRAKITMKRHPKKPLSPKDYIQLTNNCDHFKEKRRFIEQAINKQEHDFPLAYGISIYKDIEQFERLLRVLYRPQNYYCVHIDLKSPQVFRTAVERISRCFSHVIMSSRSVDVKWGYFSVLETYLICLEDLLTRFSRWKYFINLAGQEFPLKTNAEIVNNLMSLNGKSLVDAGKPTRKDIKKRVLYVHEGQRPLVNKPKTPFKYKFTFFKGSTYVILSRDFANFSLTDHVAKEFMEWVKDTGHPDETFFPSVFVNYWLPASHESYDPSRNALETIRYATWKGSSCSGKFVRQVCIHGVGSLKELTSRHGLFVNKFHLDFEYLALDCIEQWLYNKTLNEFRNEHQMVER